VHLAHAPKDALQHPRQVGEERLREGIKVQGSGFRVQGSGFRVQGSGFRYEGSGFRVALRVEG
jgi:hypothetical protein